MTRMTKQEDDTLVRNLRLIEQSHRKAQRRWDHRRHVSMSDVAVWTMFTLAVVVGLLALCLLLVLVWP